MSRPPDYEWSVLDENSDPIPGDPDEIRRQSTRLGKMGDTIRAQVKLLRKVSADPNLSVGKYADKLRDSATELEGGLATLATRYESVGGYLGKWATDLEHAQSESLRALAKAQAAAPTANAPQMTAPPGSPQPKPTPAEKTAQAANHKKLEAAKTDLSDAKTQLANAKSHRDDRGRHWKQKIEDAEHDSLKDHGLGEWLSNEIHDHAALIKLLADVCTWIVTALVIAALLIPGFDVLPLLLFAIAGAALVGHTALAINGDGSWVDVAMDVVAVVTIGTGGIAASGLKAAGKVAQGIIDGAEVGEGAEQGAAGATEAVAEGAEGASEGAAPSVMSKVAGRVADYGKYLGRSLRAGGDSGAAENMEKIGEAIKVNPNSRWAVNVAARANGYMHTVRLAGTVGNAFDQFGHWTGDSDAINFVGNGLATGHWTDGSILHGSGAAHPIVEGDFAPNPAFMDSFKKLTTVGFE